MEDLRVVLPVPSQLAKTGAPTRRQRNAAAKQWLSMSFFLNRSAFFVIFLHQRDYLRTPLRPAVLDEVHGESLQLGDKRVPRQRFAPRTFGRSFNPLGHPTTWCARTCRSLHTSNTHRSMQ